MTKEEFKIEMTVLTEFYDKQLNTTQARMWFKATKHYSKKLFRKKIELYIYSTDSSFFPPISKVKEQKYLSNKVVC